MYTANSPCNNPDANEFIALSNYFSSLPFDLNTFAFGLSINPVSMEKEKADWKRWWKSNRNEYRANHRRDQRLSWRDKRRDKRPDRRQQVLERRANKRHDSVVPSPIPRSSTDTQQQGRVAEVPRELFPGWRSHYASGHEVSARHSYVTQSSSDGRRGYRRHELFDGTPNVAGPLRDRHEGYQVLLSRPGDAVGTRQGHRRARVLQRRDVDGVYARRRNWEYRGRY